MPRSSSRASSIQRAVGIVAEVEVEHLGDLPARGGLVVRVGQLGAAADHLADRPEGDALAVGGRAALVPPDPLGDAVEVLLELPGEAALAHAAAAEDRDVPDAPLAARGVEEVLEQPELHVAADERRLEALGPAPPAALGDDANGPPCRHRRLLALEGLLAGGLEGDGPRRGPERRFADEDGPRHGGGLETGRRVDDVAGDHALVPGVQGDRRFAGQDATARLDARG